MRGGGPQARGCGVIGAGHCFIRDYLPREAWERGGPLEVLSQPLVKIPNVGPLRAAAFTGHSNTEMGTPSTLP